MSKRLIAAAVCGILTGLLYTAVSIKLSQNSGIIAENILSRGVWRVFIFAILSAIGAIATELKLPDPDAA